MIKKLIFLVFVGMMSFTFAEFVIENAKAETIIKGEYEKDDLKGKKIAEVYYHQNMVLDLFVAPDGVLNVELPYRLIAKPVYSANDLFSVFSPKGTDFFIVKVKRGPEAIGETDHQFIAVCEHGIKKGERFTVVINMSITDKKDANTRIVLYDGEADELKKDKKMQSIIRTVEEQKVMIEDQNDVINYFNFYDVKRFAVDEAQVFDGVTFTLKNVTNSLSKFYYNYEVDYAGKTYDLKEKKIRLYTQNYSKGFLVENKDKTIISVPEKVIEHYDQEQNYVTFVFASDDINKNNHYSKIEIGDEFKFENKIDMNEALLKRGELFDVSY